MNIVKRIIHRLTRDAVKYNILSPRISAPILYKLEMGNWPHIRHPRDFNEFILHESFYGDTSKWPRLADKYRMREYLHEKNLDKIAVPVLAVYNPGDKINFDSLPDRFVIKSNNSCHQVIIVTDKNRIDRDRVNETVAHWFDFNDCLPAGELHYARIEPKVIIEKYIGNPDGSIPFEYKFICLNGSPELCVIIGDRNIKTLGADIKIVYRTDPWEVLDKELHEGEPAAQLPPPANLDKMLEICRILSEGFPQVRIDLYDAGDKIYISEFTFTAVAGKCTYISKQELRNMYRVIGL